VHELVTINTDLSMHGSTMKFKKYRKRVFPNIWPQTVNTHKVHIPVVTSSNNTDIVSINAKMRRIRVTIVEVKKHEVLHILSGCF